MAGLVRSELRVEGPDDDHATYHLLLRHGIECHRERPAKPPDHPIPDAHPTIKQCGEHRDEGGESVLLRNMVQEIKLATGRTVGFVVDADATDRHRWAAVRGRLQQANVATTDEPPEDGFIGVSAKYHTTVGVWLMPDNVSEGNLEDFLKTLARRNAKLFDYASYATDRAVKKLGANIPSKNHDKALLHCWLAWQEKPGLRYGEAIAARYFEVDSEVALRFVAWFKRLYGIESATAPQ